MTKKVINTNLSEATG